MGPRKSTFARTAWSVLRLALVWARKGGALKRKNQKWLQQAGAGAGGGSSSKGRSDGLRYIGERQLSFDETPAFHFRMHLRPASMRLLSCVNPSAAAAELEDCEDRDYFRWNKEDYICSEDDGNVGVEKGKEVFSDDDDDDDGSVDNATGCELICKHEQEIDLKAEEFITKFYAQMKMQRQISFLQYNEMLERGCG